MPELTTDYTAWCKNHFKMLADQGTWAIPRSGLVFQKQGDKLVLTALMPYMEEMKSSGLRDADDLEVVQLNDFETIRWHFKQAGISVERGEFFDDCEISD